MHTALDIPVAVAHLAVGSDREDVSATSNFDAMPPGCRRQRVGDGAHAADRDVPVTGAAAEQVVQEADVLSQ